MRSNKPNEKKRFNSVSLPVTTLSKANVGFEMRPDWAALAASAQF